MSKIIYILVSLLVLLILTFADEYSSNHCKIHKTEKTTIVCTGRNLTSIPIHELNQLNASSIQILDISNNNLKLSTDDVASLLNYSNYLKNLNRLTLLKLLVNQNAIENLPNLSDVLPNLIEINLQCNNITYLTARQLFGYEKLRTVCLDHNPLNDTVLENLKRKLPQIHFKCQGSHNSLGEETRKCVENDVTTSNTKEESAKTTETTNSASEETPTTKSDSFLSTNSSKTTEENDTVSTTPVEDDITTSSTREESATTLIGLLIFFSVLGVVVSSYIIYSKIYQKRKKSKQKLEAKSQENLPSFELKLLDRGCTINQASGTKISD